MSMNEPVIRVRDALRALQSERHYFSIAVYVVEGEFAIRIAAEGARCGQCDRVSLSEGNIGIVARNGRTHTIADVSTDMSYKSCFPQVRSETVVPVLSSGRVVAVIDVESDREIVDPDPVEMFAADVAAILVTPA